jgi:hypothetical protein
MTGRARIILSPPIHRLLCNRSPELSREGKLELTEETRLMQLPRHLFLKRCCTTLAAEAVGLSAYYLRDRRTSRNKDAADRILDHLVFAVWEPLRLPVPEFPERAAQEEVEDDQQDEDEDDSIHSGASIAPPQSYGTVGALST